MRPWRWGGGGGWEIGVFGVLGFKLRFFLVKGGLVSFVAVGEENSVGRFDGGSDIDQPIVPAVIPSII